MATSFRDRTDMFRSMVAQYQQQANASIAEAAQTTAARARSGGYVSVAMSGLEDVTGGATAGSVAATSVRSVLGPGVARDEAHPLHARSKFNQAARQINGSITTVTERLEKLAMLARQRTLFNDPVADVNRLVYVIKQDLGALNHDIDALEAYAQSGGGAGDGSGAQSKQAMSNSKEIVTDLKTKLMTTSKSFADALKMRSKSLREQSARRGEYEASGGGVGSVNGAAGMGGAGGAVASGSGSGAGVGAGAAAAAVAAAASQRRTATEQFGLLRERLIARGGTAAAGGGAGVSAEGGAGGKAGGTGDDSDVDMDIDTDLEGGRMLAAAAGAAGGRGGVGTGAAAGSAARLGLRGPGGATSSSTSSGGPAWMNSGPSLPQFESLLRSEDAAGGAGADDEASRAQQAQMMQLRPVQQDDYMQSRANAVQQLQSTIEEIATMYQRLNELVLVQEEMAIRIDANVEETLVNVEGGHTELIKYMDSLSSGQWLIIKVFAVLIMFAVFFVSFVA